MTPQEFKAWFDGFTEAFEGKIPTKAQWTRIKERVGEIDGKPVTERVYIDRYWPTYTYPMAVPLAQPYRYWCGTSSTSGSSTLQNLQQMAGQNSQQLTSFNSLSAMNDLGRLEASNLGVS